MTGTTYRDMQPPFLGSESEVLLVFGASVFFSFFCVSVSSVSCILFQFDTINAPCNFGWCQAQPHLCQSRKFGCTDFNSGGCRSWVYLCCVYNPALLPFSSRPGSSDIYKCLQCRIFQPQLISELCLFILLLNFQVSSVSPHWQIYERAMRIQR